MEQDDFPYKDYSIEGEQILTRASSAQATQNNQLTCLFDSTENFPAWKKALSEATESILIEMYIFSDNTFGQEIRQILIDKAKSGLCVILIYDWIGSLKAHYCGFFKPLLQAGAIVKAYNKITFTSGLGLLARNHRKQIIIDRKEVFISGLCISSQWEGKPHKGILPWRDTGVKTSGPVITQAIKAFEDTLRQENIITPAILDEPLPPFSNGDVITRLVASAPDNGNMIRLDLFLISMAQKTLWITDAYFMATGIYITLLKNAARDGVDVRLLVPKTSDIGWIGAVSRTQYKTLLQSGVRVFEWNGSMIHAKTCVIDSLWVKIGSSNLNLSSWFANRELDVTIQNAKIGQQMSQKFLEDLEYATEVVLNKHDSAQLKTGRPKQKKPAQAKAQGVAQQALRLSEWLKVERTRTIGKPENMAILGFGFLFITLALILIFFPRIIAYPLAFMLVVSGTIMLSNATVELKKIKTLKEQEKQQKSND